MIVIIVMIIGIMSGCQKTPTYTVISSDKENYTSGNIEGNTIIEDETTESWEDMNVVSITTENINESFQVGNKTITFKGTISIPDRTNGLYTYKAIKTSYDEYFENMSFLFGEYEDEAYVPTDFFTGELEIGALEVRSEDGYHASIQNSRAEDIEVRYPPSNIHFRVIWDGKVDDSEVPVYMTNEEAQKKADDIIEKIGVSNFEFHEFVYGHNPVFDGNYPLMDTLSVRYRQYLQGIPVISYYGQHDECGIMVRFVSRGLDSVWISEYSFERIARNRQCLTYEEALESFKKYVDSCNYYDGAIFTDINLQYVIKEEFIDGEKIRLVIPCYKFDTLLEPALNNQFPDVFVDARNGMIYSREYFE